MTEHPPTRRKINAFQRELLDELTARVCGHLDVALTLFQTDEGLTAPGRLERDVIDKSLAGLLLQYTAADALEAARTLVSDHLQAWEGDGAGLPTQEVLQRLAELVIDRPHRHVALDVTWDSGRDVTRNVERFPLGTTAATQRISELLDNMRDGEVVSFTAAIVTGRP